jgi:hypothetical protein
MIMVFNLIDGMDMIVRTVVSRMLMFILMNNIVMGVFMGMQVAVIMRMLMSVFVGMDLALVRMFMIVHMCMGMFMLVLVVRFFFHEHILL